MFAGGLPGIQLEVDKTTFLCYSEIGAQFVSLKNPIFCSQQTVSSFRNVGKLISVIFNSQQETTRFEELV